MTRNSAGSYSIFVDGYAYDAAMLVPVATLEADVPPNSALTARHIYIN